MLSLAFLAACTEWSETPGDSRWNPYDNSEALWSKGAEYVEQPYEDTWYDYDGAFHDDYDYTLTYDASNVDLSNADLRITGARFGDHYNYDEWLDYDGYGRGYYDYDEDYSSDMTFYFRLNDGTNCTAAMERSGYLFDPDIDWQFRYDSNHPENTMSSSSNYYSCPNDLSPERAIGGINDILRR